ncbi:MAG TPA: hypothetical protein VL860_15550 [Planctomycetota bacterium]|nr:hypothetical protein [Planctomycetota bacterium]
MQCSPLFRRLVGVGLMMVLMSVAGCAPETVEESQSRRMREMSEQSYTEQKIQERWAEPGGPEDPGVPMRALPEDGVHATMLPSSTDENAAIEGAR